MIVGQPFADFVLEYHSAESRELTQAEAIELLQAEHERGHVHTAWFKDACLDRFFAICNCCKCCCGGTEAMVRHRVPMMASSGYVAAIDESRCAGCGWCRDACPFEAVEVNGKAVIRRDVCLGCGVCADQCRRGAIALVRDPTKGISLDVCVLAAR